MLTTTSDADATISTQLDGNSVATSKPSPKNIADLTLCVWQLTVSPYNSLYYFLFCVHKTG
ncbi:MAG: hypothetical protein U0L76_03240 [Ruminococcus sp.]|nr:hypothetical protein [Ruminococcus sp.]